MKKHNLPPEHIPPMPDIPTSSIALRYEIVFYRTGGGREPVREWLDELNRQKDRDSVQQAQKIQSYLHALQVDGLSLRRPIMDSLGGEIYELRPLRNRILFASLTGNQFVLLHHFVKSTQKTPPHELQKAKDRLKDLRQRQPLLRGKK